MINRDCVLSSSQSESPLPDYVKLSVFNVGQGNLVLLRKGKNAVLIDAGSISSNCSSSTTESIENELKDVTIKAMIVTHVDDDHWRFVKAGGRSFGGIHNSLHEALTRGVNKPMLIIGRNSKKTKNVANKLMQALEIGEENLIFSESDLEYDQRCSMIRDTLNTALGVDIRREVFQPLLPPDEIKSNNNNDHSVIISFSTYNSCRPSQLNTLLFTGDATKTTLTSVTRIEQNRNILEKTNIAILPHHGSDTHGSEKWLTFLIAKCPEFLCGIYSIDAEGTKFHHPRDIILGEKVAHLVETLSFRYKDRLFILHKKYLYLMDENGKAIKKHVNLEKNSKIGNFSKNILNTAEQLLLHPESAQDTPTFSEIISCEISSITQEGKASIPIIIPTINCFQQFAIPHEQIFYTKNGEKDRVITSFPIYTTGDTPLGVYQIFMDNMGMCVYMQPRLKIEFPERSQILYPKRSPLYGYMQAPAKSIEAVTFPVMHHLESGIADLGQGITFYSQSNMELGRKVRLYLYNSQEVTKRK